MTENKKLIEMREIELNNDIKLVTSEEEYWMAHQMIINRLNKHGSPKNVKKMIYYPEQFIQELEDIINDAVSYGVISLENGNQIRYDFYKKANYDKNFKQWILKKAKKLKKKIF